MRTQKYHLLDLYVKITIEKHITDYHFVGDAKAVVSNGAEIAFRRMSENVSDLSMNTSKDKNALSGLFNTIAWRLGRELESFGKVEAGEIA